MTEEKLSIEEVKVGDIIRVKEDLIGRDLLGVKAGVKVKITEINKNSKEIYWVTLKGKDVNNKPSDEKNFGRTSIDSFEKV